MTVGSVWQLRLLVVGVVLLCIGGGNLRGNCTSSTCRVLKEMLEQLDSTTDWTAIQRDEEEDEESQGCSVLNLTLPPSLTKSHNISLTLQSPTAAHTEKKIIHRVELKEQDHSLRVQFEVMVFSSAGCLIAYTQELLKKLTTIASHSTRLTVHKSAVVKATLVSELHGCLIYFLNNIGYNHLRRFWHELFTIPAITIPLSTIQHYSAAAQMGKMNVSVSYTVVVGNLHLEFIERGREIMELLAGFNIQLVLKFLDQGLRELLKYSRKLTKFFRALIVLGKIHASTLDSTLSKGALQVKILQSTYAYHQWRESRPVHIPLLGSLIIKIPLCQKCQKLQQLLAGNLEDMTRALPLLMIVIQFRETVERRQFMVNDYKQPKFSLSVKGNELKPYVISISTYQDAGYDDRELVVFGGIYTEDLSILMIFEVKIRTGFGPIIQLKDFSFLWALVFHALGSFHILEDKDDLKETCFEPSNNSASPPAVKITF